MFLRPQLIALAAVLFAAPAWAEVPADGWLVWSSLRQGGRHEVYRARADGTEITQLTKTGGKRPAWSPDGRLIGFNGGPGELASVMRWDGSDARKVFDGELVAWMHDGSGMVCRKGQDFHLVDPVSGGARKLFSTGDFDHLGDRFFWAGGISGDGRWLVGYVQTNRTGYPYSNGTFVPKLAENASVVLDIRDPSKIYFLGWGCQPTTSPDDLLFHVCGDEPPCENDIKGMNVADLMDRRSYHAEVAIPNPDWGHLYNPRISTDGKWLTYVANTGTCLDQSTCDYDVFIHRIGAGVTERTRVAQHPANDNWPHLYVGPPGGAAAAPPAPDGSCCATSHPPASSSAAALLGLAVLPGIVLLRRRRRGQRPVKKRRSL